MKTAIIDCAKEKAEFERLKVISDAHGDISIMPRLVSWHGKKVAVLGRWKKEGAYNYAAIRFDGQKYHEIIHPRYLKEID